MDGNKKLSQLQDLIGNINEDGFFANLIQMCLQAAIESQFDKFIGAKEYERTPARAGYRNGSYERQLNTRVGSITLNICRDRAGEFRPELFEKYQRSEKALVLGIAEMYFSGVATRKVGGIMEELCGFTISKSLVSNLTAELDNKLTEWRNRFLANQYLYLILDARYEKVREGGSIVNKAFVVIIGITQYGFREIIGCYVINSESFQEWDDCFKDLKARGLSGVKYVVADDNKGLKAAIAKNFQNILAQRCRVHYMRNFIAKLSKSEQVEGIALLKDVFAAPTKNEAMRRVEVINTFLKAKKKDKVADWIEQTIEETFAVLELPEEHRKKMSSTNVVERFNQELKRRSRVVRIFPNTESCMRLLGALCQETSESWSNRVYLNMNV